MDSFQTMDEVSAAILSCHRCPLSQTRTIAVPGQGDVNATVMFVGEGPGYEEDKQGLPFVGRSGQYLTQVMESVGIRREHVFITNVVKCRPPNNRDPEPQELAACSDYLDAQVALVNPRIIVTLGRYSMRRWFPDGAITRIHGKIRNIGHGRVALAMFHPAAALRNPQWQTAFVEDMAKLLPLVERAQKADALATVGEALPAGVPHPGDADYAGSDEPTKTADASQAAEMVTGGEPAAGRQFDAIDHTSDHVDDDAEQLPLL